MKKFHYHSVEKRRHNGKPMTRKVIIKGNKGHKSVTIKKDPKIVLLHLCTFKTPTLWAFLSEQGDADCAFSMRNGVKNY